MRHYQRVLLCAIQTASAAGDMFPARCPAGGLPESTVAHLETAVITKRRERMTSRPGRAFPSVLAAIRSAVTLFPVIE